jgi:hypothetical protein
LKDVSNIPVTNGDTIVVTGDTSMSLLTAYVKAQNTGSSGKSVSVLRSNLNLVSGTSTAFAWGVMMYSPTVNLSVDPDSIQAGATDSSFVSWYFSNAIVGTSYVVYSFFDQSNPSDSAWVVIKYVINTVAGIEENFLNAVSLYPNPGNGIFYWSPSSFLDNPYYIEIYNAAGAFMLKKDFSGVASLSSIDLTGQPAGVYFMKLTRLNKTGFRVFRMLMQ